MKDTDTVYDVLFDTENEDSFESKTTKRLHKILVRARGRKISGNWALEMNPYVQKMFQLADQSDEETKDLFHWIKENTLWREWQ